MTAHKTINPPESIRSDEVANLREQVQGKDELIAALVAELEQVVEQLDRAKRNGGDRSRSATAGAALPADVVEEHQQVLGELQKVCSQWEQLQAASTLVRIESEISELRALVSRGALRADYDDRPSTSSSYDDRPSAEKEEDESEEPQGIAWELMKRQMLGEPAPPKPTIVQANDDDGDDDVTDLLAGLPAPTPLELDTATIEVLRRACVERDAYVVQITRCLRSRRAVSLPDNWDELQGVPEDLRKHVDSLASRLEEQVRLAEVEMSLERARLSREKSQLQAERAVMERHLKRLGISSLDELEDIAVNSGSTSDRRWMRFLGVNRKT